MAKKLKILNAILCDFVGRGYANKHILVNAIAGNVFVPNLPTEVGFGIFVEMETPRPTPETMEFEIVANGERLIAGEGKLTGIGKEISSSFVVNRFEFIIEQETVLEIFVTVPGFQRACALRKTIGLNPSAATA